MLSTGAERVGDMKKRIIREGGVIWRIRITVLSKCKIPCKRMKPGEMRMLWRIASREWQEDVDGAQPTNGGRVSESV